jgi:uncharacterized membrane protein
MNDITFAAVVAAVTTFITTYPAIMIVFLAGAVMGTVIALARRLAKSGR